MNFRNIAAALAVLTGFLLSSPSQARIYIDVSAPGVQKVPLAVPLLRVTKNVRPLADRKDPPNLVIAEALRKDLSIVGEFEVLDPKGYLEDPLSAPLAPTSSSFSDWYIVGAELLVKGEVDQVGAELVVDLHAYDVFRREHIFGKRYRGSPRTAANMAHMFANALLENLTGKTGPFGSQIAFVLRSGESKNIYRSDINGSGLAAVTRNNSLNFNPVWARNGQSIYLTSYYGGQPDLCRFHLPSGELRYVYRGKGADMPGPESPDGKTLLFAAALDGNTDIFAMDTKTRAIRRLTDDRAIDVSPCWSPDGKQIVFVSDRKGNPHIFVMDAEGKQIRRITFSGKHNGDPAWSPDGEKIAYTGMDENGVFQVFITDPEGKETLQLTSGSRDTLDPSWSPDQRFLAVTSKKDGISGVYVIRLGGNRMFRVSPEGQEAAQPAWSFGPVMPGL
jgi:TolB protein